MSRPGFFLVLLALIPLAGVPGPGGSQEPAAPEERFAPLAWLEGEWQGYGLFPDDTSYIRKEFRYALRGRFLVERTIDLFPPPEPRTDYEIHQDEIYYYSSGEGFAAKGFFVEGFVWNARVEAGGDTVRVVTTDVEGGPPGFAARVTLVRRGPDRYEGTFELREPGGEFRTVERLFMRRR